MEGETQTPQPVGGHCLLEGIVRRQCLLKVAELIVASFGFIIFSNSEH